MVRIYQKEAQAIKPRKKKVRRMSTWELRTIMERLKKEGATDSRYFQQVEQTYHLKVGRSLFQEERSPSHLSSAGPPANRWGFDGE